MNAIIARTRAYLEEHRLQPDLNRAARSTAGFMVPILAAHLWELPVEVSFTAIAAQNIAQVDVRGSYPLRLGLLLAMTLVLASASWLGGATAAHLPLALVAVVLLMLSGGVWRHLNAEYGPSLAIASMLLFLIAVGHQDGTNLARSHCLATLAGGLWGLAVQCSLWPFRAQHPLRRAVADGWVALSDLIAAMAPGTVEARTSRHQRITERQALLRTALDQASATLAAAPSHDRRPYLARLEDLNLAAARFSTRVMAFNASLETLMDRPGFDALAPHFEPAITSLTNTARTVALTVVSRQPSHLVSCGVRLQRLGSLLVSLEDRILAQTNRSPEGIQVNFLLKQIAGLLPGVHENLRATVERADEHSAFSLELFDLQTWTLRPLSASLNLHWKPDAALVRFVARATVLQLIGVTAFKLFQLERGYWLPLTMLVVLQPEYGATRMRAGQRVLGTLAGSVLASILLWLALPPAVLMTAMGVTIAGFSFWLKRNYAVAVFFITLFVVLITEISTHVSVAFTLERLAATAAGGILALIAALLFWPVWERQRLPKLLAHALRENRDYLALLGRKIASGGAYDAEVIAAKRAAELANGVVFSSLQRMSADPKNQQARLTEAATLANGNQRLTQALTVIALHLREGPPLARPELAEFVRLATQTLELLGASQDSPDSSDAALREIRAALDGFSLQSPKGAEVTPLEQTVYGQFARCNTELSAMLIAATQNSSGIAAGVTARGLPSPAS